MECLGEALYISAALGRILNPKQAVLLDRAVRSPNKNDKCGLAASRLLVSRLLVSRL